jgi:hypothetical protein
VPPSAMDPWAVDQHQQQQQQQQQHQQQQQQQVEESEVWIPKPVTIRSLRSHYRHPRPATDRDCRTLNSHPPLACYNWTWLWGPQSEGAVFFPPIFIYACICCCCCLCFVAPVLIAYALSATI